MEFPALPDQESVLDESAIIHHHFSGSLDLSAPGTADAGLSASLDQWQWDTSSTPAGAATTFASTDDPADALMSSMPPYDPAGEMVSAPSRHQDPANAGPAPQNAMWQWFDNGPWTHPNTYERPAAMPSLPSLPSDPAFSPALVPPPANSQQQANAFGDYRSPAGTYRSPAGTYDNASFRTGLPSESGYDGPGPRASGASVLSYGFMDRDRDQDCRSLASGMYRVQILPSKSEPDPEPDFDRAATPVPMDESSSSAKFVCPVCHKGCRTRSELKKCDVRHRKPFACQVPDCERTYATTNDRDRHMRSCHPDVLSAQDTDVEVYRCFVPECVSNDKIWARLDNFRSHLRRMHADALPSDQSRQEMVERARRWNGERNAAKKRRRHKEQTRCPSLLAVPESESASSMAHNVHSSVKTDTEPAHRDPDLDDAMGGHMEQSLDSAGGTALSQSRSNPMKMSSSMAHDRDDPAPETTRFPDVSRSIDLGSAAESHRMDETKSQMDEYNRLEDDLVTKTIDKVLKHSGNPAIATDQSLHMPDASVELSPSLDTAAILSDSGAVNSETVAMKLLAQLQRLGYSISKDPAPADQPAVSEHVVKGRGKSAKTKVCDICHKFRGRPSAVRKHRLRHERPFGCTYPKCGKVFGSKNDWVRHENSQHYQHEGWRCDYDLEHALTLGPSSGKSNFCGKVMYRRQLFFEHLAKEHGITGEKEKETKSELCLINRGCQKRFWCGFCVSVVPLQKRGLNAWTERSNHINDHFIGRDGQKPQDIGQWEPMDSQEWSTKSAGTATWTNQKRAVSSPPMDDDKDKSHQSQPKKARRTTEEHRRIIDCCHCDNNNPCPEGSSDKLARPLEACLSAVAMGHCLSCNHEFCQQCRLRNAGDDAQGDCRPMDEDGGWEDAGNVWLNDDDILE